MPCARLGPFLPLATLLALQAGCHAERLPEPYGSIDVPEERLRSPAARAAGRELYLEHCAICHGENADGRGVRRAALDPPPRDYTDPSWRRSATPRQVFYALREGVRGTAMPAWSVLSEEQCWDLVAYVLSVAGEGP